MGITVKHGMHIAPHISKTNRKQRNSSIELLRIIAMLMILCNHYIVQSDVFIGENVPPFSFKLYILLLLRCFGKLGVMIFFTISAWYLCMEKQPTMKKALKRVWILEREVLFYSLGLLVVCYIFARQYVTKPKIIYSIFPTISGREWWYVTAYVIFLLICPSLTKGLRAIGKGAHASLCVVFVIGWGIIAGLMPLGVLQSQYDGFINFLFIYVLVAFYRWYLDDFSARTAWLMVVIGASILAISILGIQLLGSQLGSDLLRSKSTYLSQTCVKLPMLLIGFGIMLLFEMKYLFNKVINSIASTTFGVYLIHEHQCVIDPLWRDSKFSLGRFYDSPYVFAFLLTVIISVFVVAMLIDYIRQGIFACTVNRKEGRWFYNLYDYIATCRWAIRLNRAVMAKPLPHESLIFSRNICDQADHPIPPMYNEK